MIKTARSTSTRDDVRISGLGHGPVDIPPVELLSANKVYMTLVRT